MKSVYAIVLPAMLALTGCDRAEADKDAQIAELQGMVSSLTEQLETARSQADDLSTQVDRFDTEDWTAVVPSVKQGRDEVVGALEEQ